MMADEAVNDHDNNKSAKDDKDCKMATDEKDDQRYPDVVEERPQEQQLLQQQEDHDNAGEDGTTVNHQEEMHSVHTAAAAAAAAAASAGENHLVEDSISGNSTATTSHTSGTSQQQEQQQQQQQQFDKKPNESTAENSEQDSRVDAVDATILNSTMDEAEADAGNGGDEENSNSKSTSSQLQQQQQSHVNEEKVEIDDAQSNLSSTRTEAQVQSASQAPDHAGDQTPSAANHSAHQSAGQQVKAEVELETCLHRLDADEKTGALAADMKLLAATSAANTANSTGTDQDQKEKKTCTTAAPTVAALPPPHNSDNHSAVKDELIRANDSAKRAVAAAPLDQMEQNALDQVQPLPSQASSLPVIPSRPGAYSIEGARTIPRSANNSVAGDQERDREEQDSNNDGNANGNSYRRSSSSFSQYQRQTSDLLNTSSSNATTTTEHTTRRGHILSQHNTVEENGNYDDEKEDDLVGLPIAAELSPDYRNSISNIPPHLRQEIENRIRREMEERMAAERQQLAGSVPIVDATVTTATAEATTTTAATPPPHSSTTTIATTVATSVATMNTPAGTHLLDLNNVEHVDIDRSCAFEIEHGILASHHTSDNNEDENDNSEEMSLFRRRQLKKKQKRHVLMIFAMVCFILVLVAVGVVVHIQRKNAAEAAAVGETNSNNSISLNLGNTTTTNDNTTADTFDPTIPVLEAVRQRGYLNCKPESLEAEEGEGFTVDLCRAIAAAIFNDSSKVAFPNFTFKEHFEAIAQGNLDVSADHVSLNMGRDVQESGSRTGFTYSTPYLYTGTALAGVPNFVDCAEKAETFEGDCRQLLVCVTINTVTQDLVEAHLPGSATRLVQTHGDLFRDFAEGTCNVIAGDTVLIYEQNVRDVGYDGDYKFAHKLLSHEHLALLSREDDPQWGDFCNWVIKALVAAEALNITQQTADSFPKATVFGPEYENMFINAIATVGNYAELYDRHYGGILPRSSYNMINTGDTGLIVSDPLGTLLVDEESLPEEDVPKPVPNGTIEAVGDRGYLLCGLFIDDNDLQPGLAFFNDTTQDWSGLDVEYCRGLAASISGGKQIDTVFVELFDHETMFVSLANKSVDVLAGCSISLTCDVHEPTTGQGFTFATPYFYHENYTRALVTREDDPQWSDVAKWITQATFYAEEMSITQKNASYMPVVELFGLKFKQMFRDAIYATGHYGDMYNRNMEPYIPRSGRNLLNVEDTPQFYPWYPFD